MALVPVDLPTPEQMRGRWAAFAAVAAAIGAADVCHAAGAVWHYDDGGGNRAELVRLDSGRAVLLGWDRDGETYFGAAAAYFAKPATDLLAGAPAWWAGPVEEAEQPYRWIGFVYGFDGTAWWRAAHDLDDGFARLGLPAVDDATCRGLCTEFCDDVRPGGVDPAALDAVVAAGTDVTEAQLAALLGADGDPAAGVAAARRFR